MVLGSANLGLSAHSTDGLRAMRYLAQLQSKLASELGLKEGLPTSAHYLLSRAMQTSDARDQVWEHSADPDGWGHLS